VHHGDKGYTPNCTCHRTECLLWPAINLINHAAASSAPEGLRVHDKPAEVLKWKLTKVRFGSIRRRFAKSGQCAL